jgi:hypothetical protein
LSFINDGFTTARILTRERDSGLGSFLSLFLTQCRWASLACCFDSPRSLVIKLLVHCSVPLTHLGSVVALAFSIKLGGGLVESGSVFDEDSLLGESLLYFVGFLLNLFSPRTASDQVFLAETFYLWRTSSTVNLHVITELLKLFTQYRSIDRCGVFLAPIQLDRLEGFDLAVI